MAVEPALILDFSVSTYLYRLEENIFTEIKLRSFIPAKIKKNTTKNVEETENRVFCAHKSNALAWLHSISVIKIDIIYTHAVLYALEYTLNDVSFKFQIGSH